MNIRDADPARDAPGCAAVYRPFVEDTAISFEERAPMPQEFARRIHHTMATHPWLVAEEGETLIGYAYGAPHRERAAYRWAADVAVYVARSHHRRGIGRTLYTSLIDLLRAQGMKIACAGVTLPNDASVALHESLGFTPVGVYRRIGFKFDRWHDVGWWQLFLEAAPEQSGHPREPTGPVRHSGTADRRPL